MYSLIALSLFGDTFGKLFSVIWDGIKWIGGVLGDFFGWLLDGITDLFSWLGGLLKDLFQSLIDILIGFFEVIYAIIDGFLYLLYKLGVLAVKIFELFFDLAKLIWSFFVGLANTLGSLSYSVHSTSGNGYSEMLGKVFAAAEPLQLDVIGYILLFLIWIATAIGAIKLLASVRVGGE